MPSSKAREPAAGATERTPEAVSEKAREQARLDAMQARLDAALREIERRMCEYSDDVKEQKEYMWEHRREMDFIEKIASRQSIEQSELSGDALAAQRKRLHKLKRSPWFGRFDFRTEGRDAARPFYIGVHHFHDDEAGETLVYDWRAPIATLFYGYQGTSE